MLLANTGSSILPCRRYDLLGTRRLSPIAVPHVQLLTGISNNLRDPECRANSTSPLAVLDHRMVHIVHNPGRVYARCGTGSCFWGLFNV